MRAMTHKFWARQLSRNIIHTLRWVLLIGLALNMFWQIEVPRLRVTSHGRFAVRPIANDVQLRIAIAQDKSLAKYQSLFNELTELLAKRDTESLRMAMKKCEAALTAYRTDGDRM